MSTTTDVIADRYRLRDELGRGGMGVVWAAYDELLRREVAVKELRFPADVSDEDRERLAERTLREARAVAAIDSAAAVRVFDIVEQDGRPWIVMELVRGQSLSEVIAARGSLPSADAAKIGLALIEALQVAHRAGVLHRDVKPSNVILGDDGRIALTDFGIATLDDGGEDSTGVLLGSPGYLAPERINGEPPTPSSDYWSMAATLWTAVEGEPPFRGPTVAATLHAITTGSTPQCHRCTPELAGILARLMSPVVDERPPLDEVRAVFERVCRDARAARVRPKPLDPYPAGAQRRLERTTLLDSDTTGNAAAARDRSTWPLVTAVLLTLIVAAGLLALLLHTPGSSSDQRGRDGAGKDRASASPAQSVDTGGAASTPAGWQRYRDSTLGWSVALPPGWAVAASDASGVRFDDPAGGRYLQVATRYPAGSSSVAAWEEQEAAFAANHTGYQRIRLEPTTVEGARDAADWEFSYTDQGASLHALDHGFVVGDRGYALFFQTHADQWTASQSLMRKILASFRAP